MDYDNLLAIVTKKIAELPNNTIFTLRDLFSGIEWNSFPKGQRTGFGRYFKLKVKCSGIPDTVCIEKRKNGLSTYKKTN